MALHHFVISLGGTQVDATETPTMPWHTHSHLSLADKICSMGSSFHTIREQLVRHLHRHRHLPCHRASNNHNQSKQAGSRPLDQAPVSRVFHRFHVLSCTHHTKFDASHVQMQHGARSPAWSVHSRPQKHGVAGPQSLHHQCLHPPSSFQ